MAEEMLDAALCPHVVVADEGTGYCALAESTARDHAHLLAEHRAATDELRRLRAEVERLRSLYRERTAHLTRVLAERDELLAARVTEHHGSEAT